MRGGRVHPLKREKKTRVATREEEKKQESEREREREMIGNEKSSALGTVLCPNQAWRMTTNKKCE